MTAKQVVRRMRQVGSSLGKHVVESPGKGAHRKYTVAGHCKTTVSHHAGDIPVGTLRKIEKDLAHCLCEGWLTRECDDDGDA